MGQLVITGYLGLAQLATFSRKGNQVVRQSVCAAALRLKIVIFQVRIVESYLTRSTCDYLSLITTEPAKDLESWS